MSAIFYTQDMLNQVYPGINNSNILGAVDKNFYYGETTINYNIKGFMDMWGGLAIPPNPTYLDSPELFFNQDTFPKPPTIIFHGKGDQVFIYNHKNVNFYRSGMYNSESNCLQSNPATYMLNSDPNIDGYLLGGQDIYKMLKRLNIGTEYYLDCEMKHGLDNCTDTCYKSNFGVSTNVDATTTAIYMVQRAITFFQAIINSKLNLLTTTNFIECGNSRFRCFVADNNAGCYNSDTPAKCPPNP